MKTLSFLPLFTALFATTTFAQSKPALNIPYHARDADFRADVNPAKVASKNIWVSSIPRVCVDNAKYEGSDGISRCKLQNMRVFQVTFDDVPGIPWTVCYCTESAYSENRMVEEIGRLPPGIRQYVRYFLGYPGNGSGTVTGEGDLLTFGINSLLYLHEAGHIVDARRGSTKLSNAPAFLDAINRSTCWLDAYSKTNGELNRMWEPWAVAFVWRRYQRHVGSNLGVDYNCARIVLDVIGRQTDNVISGGYKSVNKPEEGEILKREDIVPWIT